MASGTFQGPGDPHSAENQSAAAASRTTQPATPASASGDGTQLPNVPNITVNTADFKEMVKLLTEISSASKETNTTLSNTMKTVAGTNTQLGKTAISLRSIIESAEHFQDSFEDVNKTLSDIAKSNTTNEKILDDQVDSLQKMKKYYSDIVASNEASGEELKKTQTQLDGINRALGAIGEKTKDGLYDPEKVSDARVELVKTTRELEKQARIKKQMEQLDQKGGRGMLRHNQRLNTLFKSSHMQQWIDVGKRGAERQKTQKDKRNEYRSSFTREARDAGYGDTFLANIPRDKQGRIKHSQLAEITQKRPLAEGTNYKDLASSMGKSGFISGRIDRHLGGKVLETMDSGKPMGFWGRMGTNMLTRGEGSMTRGILSTGMGVAEGGMGALEGMMGASAIPLAIAGLVKEGFDKRAEYNSKTEKTLASSGLFAQGGSAIDNLRAGRDNLIPRSAFHNALGMSFNQNLEIAKAISDSGIATTELTHQGERKGEFGPGGYGMVQKQVYTTARLAGFDTASAVANIIKMVTMYNQSLSGTDDFFIKLNKDSKAAGLTTLRYVQLIDEVTSNLGRMNKSFETSLALINVLGRAGKTSADDLKTYFGALTNNTQDQDRALRTYSAQTIIDSPQKHQAFINMSQRQETYSRQNAARALTDLGVSFTDKDLSENGIHDLQARIGASDGDPQRKIAASNALNQYEQSIRDTKNSRLNNAMEMATGEGTLGQGTVQKLTNVQNLLDKVLVNSGTTLGDVLDNRTGAEDKLLHNPTTPDMLGVFGFKDQESLKDTLSAMRLAIDSTIGGLKKSGVAYGDGGLTNDLYNKLIHGGATTDQDKISAVQNLANTNDGSYRISKELSNSSTLLDMISKAGIDVSKPVSPEEHQDALNKAIGLSVNTQTSEQLLEHFLEPFLKKMFDALDTIAKVLTSSLMLNPTGAAYGQYGAQPGPSANTKSQVDALTPQAGAATKIIESQLEKARKANGGSIDADTTKLNTRAALIADVVQNGVSNDAEGQAFIAAINDTLHPDTTKVADTLTPTASRINAEFGGTLAPPMVTEPFHPTTGALTPALTGASLLSPAIPGTNPTSVTTNTFNTYTPLFNNTKASGGSLFSNSGEGVTRPNTPAGNN
jgi:hypothetical protein